MVIGASPTEKPDTCCGTLSSRIRKLPLGIFGMKLPRLSSTAASTLIVSTSAVNVGTPSGSSPSFFGNFDGILGRSGSVAGAAAPGFLGRATVSLPLEFGPCCARENTAAPSEQREMRANTRKAFMLALYQIRRKTARRGCGTAEPARGGPRSDRSREAASAQKISLSCTHMLRIPLSVKSRFRKREGGEPATLLSGT